MAARLFRRFHHLFMGGLRTAEFDVVLDGIFKEIHLLKDDGEVPEQAVTGVFPHIVSAQQDLTLLHIPKPGDQAAQCGLAGAGGAYDGAGGSLRDGKAHIVDDLILPVGKGYVPQLDVQTLGGDLSASFIQSGYIQNRVHTVERGLDHTGHGGHASHQLHAGIDEKAGHQQQQALDRRDLPARQQIRSNHQDRGLCQLEYGLIDRCQRGEHGFQPDVCFGTFADRLIHSAVGTFSKAKRLYHAHPLHIFQNGCYQIGLSRLPPGRQTLARTLLERVYQQGNSQPRKHQRTNMPLVKQKPQPDDQRMKEASRHPLQHHDRVAFDISQRGSGCCGNIAQPVLAEIAHRGTLELFPDLQALFRAEGKAAQRPPGGGKAAAQDAPQDTDHHDAQRDPDRFTRHACAGNRAQNAGEDRQDRQNGQHLKDRVQ